MKKSIAIVGGIVALILIVWAAFALMGGDKSYLDMSGDSSPATQEGGVESSAESPTDTVREFDQDAFLERANVMETVDATDQTEYQAEIGDMFFDPTVLTVSAGTTVTWTNEGAVGHTVTSTSDSPLSGLDSALLQSGESYSFTFSEPGTYAYFCVPHPVAMKGVVHVVE